MKRIRRQIYAEVIAAAFSAIPPTIAVWLEREVDFLTDTDPVYAGLHSYIDIADGRSYRNTAHCVYTWHQRSLPKSLRKTTIVLPQPRRIHTVIHELGHALDALIGFSHIAKPCTNYARTDRDEAFAEAFTAWLVHDYATIKYPTVDEIDLETLMLFEGLVNNG